MTEFLSHYYNLLFANLLVNMIRKLKLIMNRSILNLVNKNKNQKQPYSDKQDLIIMIHSIQCSYLNLFCLSLLQDFTFQN